MLSKVFNGDLYKSEIFSLNILITKINKNFGGHIFVIIHCDMQKGNKITGLV